MTKMEKQYNETLLRQNINHLRNRNFDEINVPIAVLRKKLHEDFSKAYQEARTNSEFFKTWKKNYTLIYSKAYNESNKILRNNHLEEFKVILEKQKQLLMLDKYKDSVEVEIKNE